MKKKEKKKRRESTMVSYGRRIIIPTDIEIFFSSRSCIPPLLIPNVNVDLSPARDRGRAIDVNHHLNISKAKRRRRGKQRS